MEPEKQASPRGSIACRKYHQTVHWEPDVTVPNGKAEHHAAAHKQKKASVNLFAARKDSHTVIAAAQNSNI